jgi:glycosyltransferase involved in cell wall biosynthesis
MSNLNILIDHQIFSLQTYGGISRYFVDLHRGINEHSENINSSFEAMFSSNFYLNRPNEIQSNSWLNSKATYATNELFASTQNLFSKKTFDVHHQTYFYNTGYRKSKSRVMTFYDCIPERFPNLFNSDKVILQKQKALSKCDAVIAISEQTKQDLMSFYGIAEERIRLIYLSPPKLFYSEEPKISGNYILFVGNRAGYKNFQNFIMAFSQSQFLKNNFKVVCFGGPNFSVEEKQYLNKLKLNDSQVFRVNGVDKDLGNYYKHASCFVFPSLYEGFGLPILEALQSGTTLCCSDIGCFREIASKSANFFNPNDVESIKFCVEQSLSEDKQNEDDFNWQKFSLDTMVSNHLKLYRGM